MTSVIINGKDQSGNIINITYLPNCSVTLCYADLFDTKILSQTVTDQYGNFIFTNNNNMYHNIDGIFYIIAELCTNVKLLCIIGNNLSVNNIVVNEITTIAGLYCFNNFYNNGLISGNSKSLNTASLMYFNFVNYNGTLSDVIKLSPNGYETNSMQLLNSLGNLISICISNYEIYKTVVTYTTIATNVPSNIFDILISIIRNPSNNVKLIFVASLINKIYNPYLPFDVVPDAFTLAIKVNNSGDINNLIGGMGNIVFDDNGNAWITNNVIQGTPNSSNFTVVLLPNGKPAPFSPLFGGGANGAGFGIVKYFNNIIIGNYGWGNSIPAGGLTIYSKDGHPLTGNNGFQDSLYRVQGISVDINNNIWVASYGNSSVVVYIKGNLDNKKILTLPNEAYPFDIKNDKNGNAIVSLKGSSAVLKLYLDSNNDIKVSFNVSIGSTLLGIALDSNCNIFVASADDSSIYKLSNDGTVLQVISGNGIYQPWSCTIDGNDNLWVANFGANLDTNLYGVPHFTNNGIMISPSTGYTLPTGGSQVLLNDGTPLYGVGSSPSYNPLMRQTVVKIDCAGNVWVANNWKPSTPEVTDNPSGDGIVIFVGIGVPVI